VESVAAPLVRADAPNIEEPVNAVCSGMAILRRFSVPGEVGGGWGVSEVVEGFVTTLDGILAYEIVYFNPIRFRSHV
jgi:hypothetical protein